MSLKLLGSPYKGIGLSVVQDIEPELVACGVGFAPQVSEVLH